MSRALAAIGGIRSRAWRSAPLGAALGLVLLCAGPVPGADAPNLSGTWKLNHELSDDTAAKVKEAAGSEYIQGGPSWATETWFPWGRKFNEDERILLRDVLLAAVRGLERIEVEQTASEIKTVYGEEGLRVFYLTRAASGTNLVTGETVKRTAQWKGAELVLESAGKKGKAREVMSLVPAKNQLVDLLHLEMDPLKHPMDLRLVYDRVGVAP
jgi:hypothetical protein